MRDSSHVAIIGAGTMGAGIAQVAATAGWTAWLMDVEEATARKAIDGIRRRLDRLVERGELSAADRDGAAARLRVATRPADAASCELLLEAVVEDLDVKAAALRAILPAARGDAIIATNTSSLSVTGFGEAIGRPRRTVGMHFFNPAPLMKLVEVIAGRATDPAVVDRAEAVARAWGKITARAADVPGFIVNHVARPYYLEAFRILEEGLADAAGIDAAMRDLGGFRMGPLELTDLIGQDVNAATTRQVWEQLGRPQLLRPSALQERLVRQGHLGRKTGRGVYVHDGQERGEAAVTVERRALPADDNLRRAVRDFTSAATHHEGNEVAAYVFARILVAVIAQAALAHERGVAGKADIDTALRYGTNYPRGPFEWAASIGPERCERLRAALLV